LQNLVHRRAALVLILACVRPPSGLTEVLLREACDPCFFRGLEPWGVRISILDVLPTSIEALNNEHPLISEHLHVRVRHRQAELLEDLCAQPLILDGVPKVELTIADEPERQFQYMGRRGGSEWLVPVPPHFRERCFFLCAGERDPKILSLVDPVQERRGARG